MKSLLALKTSIIRRSAMSRNDSDASKRLVTPEKLRERYSIFDEKYNFSKGDIVKWKPLLKDRRLPLENEPAVVIEVLDKPVFDKNDDAGSPYFNIPYDIILGVIGEEDDFLTFYYNSKRFMPYEKNS